MSAVLFLIPIALFLGVIALIAFLWALRSGQYEDMDGAARRILNDDSLPAKDTSDEDTPAND